jgi:hypothetical protein
MEKPASFYVEPPPRLIEWAKSDEGREAFQQAENDAEQTLQELDRERAVTREMLLEPITF